LAATRDARLVPSGSPITPIVNAIKFAARHVRLRSRTPGPPPFSSKFHPGLLEGLADDVVVRSRERGRARHELGAADGGDAHCAVIGEVFGAPADESAGGPDLGTGQWRGHL
jgi:hypothetical protein